MERSRNRFPYQKEDDLQIDFELEKRIDAILDAKKTKKGTRYLVSYVDFPPGNAEWVYEEDLKNYSIEH